MKEDVHLFLSSFIYCLSSTEGIKVPRHFGPALFSTKQNDLVRFDFIDPGLSRSGEKYALMIRDDHSGYSWLYPTLTTDAEPTANAL